MNMGATCTRLEVSPEVARSIRQRPIHISDARFESVWACISPSIKSAVERCKIRRLLSNYLDKSPCKDRYLVLYFHDIKWIFEITSHRRTPDYTELVLSQHSK
jgi:hypothetical protein